MRIKTVLFAVCLLVVSSCKKDKKDYVITYQTEGENYSVSYADKESNNFIVLVNQSGKKEFIVNGYAGFITQVSATSNDPTKIVSCKIFWRGEILNSQVQEKSATVSSKIIE
ncbi:MAG: hypothetical protein JWN56_386 [Sphingobacteriales bacterium]|nr:hypothetical protein [Sphingobacteriales bacterium]